MMITPNMKGTFLIDWQNQNNGVGTSKKRFYEIMSGFKTRQIDLILRELRKEGKVTYAKRRWFL